MKKFHPKPYKYFKNLFPFNRSTDKSFVSSDILKNQQNQDKPDQQETHKK